MRLVGWFQVVTGVSIAGLWGMLVATGQVPEIDQGRVDIWFHLAAELLTAGLLVTAGVAVLRRSSRGRPLAAVALGALAYTTINSPGYYAESGDWAVVGLFALLFAATVAAICGFVVSSQEPPDIGPGVVVVPRRRAQRPRAVWLLIGLLWFQGLGAVGGGATMLADTSGAAAGLTPDLLARTPFTTYLWPGLLLTIGLGITALVLAIGMTRTPRWPGVHRLELATGHHWTWAGSIALGIGLMAWIVVQVLLIERAWLQPVMFLVGAALVGLPLLPSVRRHLTPAQPAAAVVVRV